MSERRPNLVRTAASDDGSGTTAANLVNTAYRGTLVDPGGCYGDVCQEMTCRSTLSVSAIFNPR